MRVRSCWGAVAMTVLSKFRPNTSSGLVPHEEIRECISWEFGDIALNSARQLGVLEQSVQVTVAREEAYAQGLTAGRALAELEMQQEMDRFKIELQRHAAQSLDDLLQSARQGVCDVQAKMADDLLALVCDLSRQVLRRELSETSIASMLPIVDEALEMLNADAELAVVRLHPEDFHMLQPHLPAAKEDRPLQWTADPAVPAGGCVVDSAGAHIDASVPRRWARAVGELGLSIPWQQEDPHAV